MRRFLVASVVALCAGATFAKLPPLSDEAKTKAAEAAHKAAWADKVNAYKTCQVEDRLVAAYRAHALAAGQPASAAEQTPPCSDPGPYHPAEVTPQKDKPLEASGAHSPPGNATSPPSNKATSSEMNPRK